MKSKTIIFVHPFTSVEFSLARTKQRGYNIITIKTPFDKVWIEAQWAEIVKFTDFVIESQGDVEDDLAKLRELEVAHDLEICAVINSLDGSIFYGDSLANHLLGFQIDLEDSQRRTNKFAVNERLREAGHSFIRSTFVASKSDFEQKSAEIRQFTLPIVIKPASNSAARHDVKILHSFDGLEETVDLILSKGNLFGSSETQQLMIQEFIAGEEYVVDTVSFQGKHFCAGVFKNSKEGDFFKGIELVDSSAKEKVDVLIEHNLHCLQATNVEYGLTHNELMLSHEGVPFLIEMNNRMSGADIPLMAMDCHGINEIDMFLDLLEKRETVAFDLKGLNRSGIILYFANFYVNEPTHLDLTGVVSDSRLITFRPAKVDKDVEAHGDLFIKVSAVLYLSHFSSAQLAKDVELLRAREKNGSLFVQ